MSLNNPPASLNFAAEFQSAGLPWVSSSVGSTSVVHRHSFHHITRAIVVRNNATGSTDSIAVGFTHNGVLGTNRFVILPGHSDMFEVRVKELYVKAVAGGPPYSILASLTNVLESMMPQLSGTLSNGDPGWEGVG